MRVRESSGGEDDKAEDTSVYLEGGRSGEVKEFDSHWTVVGIRKQCLLRASSPAYTLVLAQ